jgi:hypothetical protein
MAMASSRAGSAICEHCLVAFPTADMRVALVPDSSFVHPDDPSLDGCRLVRACGQEHLNELIEHARATWAVEQLWFGRLVRESGRAQSRGASVVQLARLASLSPERLRQALAWNANQDQPLRTLPGGQELPTRQVTPPDPIMVRHNGVAVRAVPLVGADQRRAEPSDQARCP